MNNNGKKYIIADWYGKRYGNLVIKDYKDCHFICKCDCGNEKIVKPSFLFNGKVQTCGLNCPIHNKKFDGHSNERLYKIWSGMKQRCYNKNHFAYYRYGGNGILICDEWRNSYKAFKEWALNNGYEDHLTIDRIDGKKGYYPENCRWATYKQQRANAANPYELMEPGKHFRGKLYEINGELKPKTEWCYIYGVSVPFVDYRLKHGMSLEEALKTPKQKGIILSEKRSPM